MALLGVVAPDGDRVGDRAPAQRGRKRHGSMRVNSMRIAGSSVIASSAAIAIARFFE